MKKLLYSLTFILTSLFNTTKVVAQTTCLASDFPTATRVPSTAYPYTFTGSDVTASVSLTGITNYLGAYSTSCGASSFSTVANSWWIDNPADSIVITFSHKVTNFSFVLNGTDGGEKIIVTAATGSVNLTDFCTGSFSKVVGIDNELNASTSGGTYVSVNNASGSYTYTIKHSGFMAGSLIQLLDCITAYRGPANIVDGIQLWLDGSNVNNLSGTNPADTTKIAVWKDISGNKNNATVLAGQDTARMNTSQINGKDVMQFTRGSDAYGSVYEVANIDIRAVSMPELTIFTVYRQGAKSSGVIHGIWGNDDGGWDRFFLSSFGSDNGAVSVGAPTNYVSVANAGVVGETKLLTAVYDHGVTDSTVVYYNALPVNRVQDNSSSTAAKSTFRIGWDGDGSTFNGDIAELVMYNRKLSECEIRQVNRYFAYKYNVSLTTATITPSAPQKICASVPLTLTASTGTSYKWLKDGLPIASATSSTYAASATGNYSVVVENPTGCFDTSLATAITAVPGVLYVDSSKASSGDGSSWANAFKTVNEALDLANSVSGCETQIWVKKGTYYPTTNTGRDSSFRIARNNIKLYGGFSGTEILLSDRSVTGNLTILSGDIGVANDSTDNAYHVITIFGRSTAKIDSNTVVDGFTITKGNAQSGGSYTYAGLTYNRQDGAGAFLYGGGSGNQCSPLISNCIFSRNSANFGGGIYAAGFSAGNSGPILRKNTFTQNKANNNGCGAFLNTQGSGISNSTIDECTFSANFGSYGGGIFFQGGSGGTLNSTVTNCTFTANNITNQGGGVYANSNATVVYSNCTFSNNTADGGAGIYNASTDTATISDSRFINNTATTSGGGLRNNSGILTATRCIFYNNTASHATNGSGGGFISENTSNATFTNCVFANNTAAGTTSDGGGAINLFSGTTTLNSTTFSNNTTASTSKPNANSINANAATTLNLNNTIVWGNATNHIQASGTASYNYSLVKGLALTAPNLTSDPRFINPSTPAGTDGLWLTADDGLELLPCSPAINAATTSPATDIRNRSRLGLPDMGAYEEQGGTLPTAPVVTTPVTYCQNATAVVLTATKTSATDTLKWYNSSMTLLSGAPTPSTTVAGSTSYYVSQTNVAGCESAKSLINVVVNPLAGTPTVSSPVTYCQGVTAVALTATAASGTDVLKWYNSSLTLLAGAPTPSTATAGSTDYYVSGQSSLGCEGTKIKITVVVNPTPALPTSTTPVVYCQGVTATALTATTASGSDTLKWYDAVPSLLAGAPTPSTSTVGSTTYYVSQKTALGCEGAKRTITVTVNLTPIAPPSTTPVTYCQDDVATVLTATKALTSDTLKWYNATPSLLGAAPTPNTTTAGTTIYYVSAKSSASCEGSKTMITVNVNPKPAAPTVVTPIDRCIGIPSSALSATGINLKWYNVATGGTSLSSITPSTAAVGATNFYVSQTSLLGCEGPRATLTVNVRPSPTVTITPLKAPAFVFCINDSVTLKATSATATNYQWYNETTAIVGATSDTVSVKTTADYRVIVKNVYGCADTETVNVIENPLKTPSLSPNEVFICDGVDIMLYGNPTHIDYKYEWFKDGLDMGLDTTTNKTPVNLSGIYHIRITDYYKCVLNTNFVTVTTYPALAKPVIIRLGSVLKLSSTYASYQWYRNGKIIPGATSSSYTMTHDGDYHVVVTDKNDCEAESDAYNYNSLGVKIQNNIKGIKIYPNPSNGTVWIESNQSVNIQVLDATGRKILSKENTKEIDLSLLADGMYLFYINDKEGKLLMIEKVQKSSK
ncbi:MAG: T9SS type A sorting domain-containing protein [Bacteroidota bacterium]